MKSNGVRHSMSKKSQSRRLRVIERLENQLKANQKRVREIDSLGVREEIVKPLTDSDIKRIQKEIETLKSRC